MEDEADFFSAEASLFFSRDAGGGLVVQEVDAGGGGVEETDDVEESGFAAAGGTHDHDEFAALDGEVEVFESVRSGVTVAEAFGETLEFDDGLVGVGFFLLHVH